MDDNRNSKDNRVAKQEKGLIILCVVVAVVMLLALSRRIFS